MNRAKEAVEVAADLSEEVVEAAVVVDMKETEVTKETDPDHAHTPHDQEDGAHQPTPQSGEHHFQGHDPIQDQIIKQRKTNNQLCKNENTSKNFFHKKKFPTVFFTFRF